MIEENIILKPAKGKPGNLLAGATAIAIEKAERYKTNLVIKNDKGQIREVTPAQMRKALKQKSA